MEALKRIRSLSGFEQAQQPVTKSEPLEGDIGPSAGPADSQPISQASEPAAAVDAAVASIDCAVHEAQEGRIIEKSADDAIQLGAKQKHDSSSSNLSSNSDIDSLNKVTKTLQKTPIAQEENQYLVQTIPVIEKSAVEQSITAQVPSAAADVSVSCSNQSFSEQVLSCRSDNLIDKSSKLAAETSSVARTNLVKSNQKDKVVQDFEEQSAKRSPDNKDDDIISVAPTIENVLEIETNLETDVKKTNTSQVILQQQKRLDLQTTTSFLDSDLVDNSQQILSKVDLTSKVSATSQEKLSSTESQIPIPTKSGSNSEILSAQNLLEETEFESVSVSERKVSHKTYKIQTETESEDAGPNKSDKAKQWTKKALKTSAFAIGAAAASVVVLPALGAAAIGAGTGKAVKSAIARSKKASSPDSKTDLSDSEEQQVEFSPLSETSDNPGLEFGKPKNFTESESLKELAELNAQIVEFDNSKKSSQISSDEIDFAKSKIPKLIESERNLSVSNKPQEVFIEPDVDISASEEISTNSEAQSEYSANISGLSKVVELTELDSSKVDSTRSIESESISKDFSKDSLEVTEKVDESESRSSSQSEENSGETISTESPHLQSVSNSEISTDSRKHSIELQRVESTESHEVSIDLQGVESRKLSIELTVSEGITSKVEFTGSEVELLQSQIELIDSKVELAESEIELLKSKIELIDSQVESTESKVESTEANLKSTESKVKSTESSSFQETSTESKVESVDSKLELTKSQEVSSELVVESHQPKPEEKVEFRESKLISPEKEVKITESVQQSETPKSTENTTAISTPVTDSIEGLQKAKGHFKPDQTPIDPAYNQSIQKDSAESKSGARSTSSLVEPGTELTDLRPESCQVKQEESQGVEPVWTDEPDLAVGAKTAVSSLEPSHTRSSQCPKETETISVEHLEAVEKQNLLPFDEKKPSEEVTYFFGTQSEDNQNDSESLIESKVKSTESKVEHLEADKQSLLPFDEKKPSEEVTYFFGTQSEDKNDSDGSENEAEPEVKEKTPTGSSAKQWTKNALKASAFAIGAAAASVVVLPALGGAAIVAGTGSAASAIAGSAVFSGTSGLAAATLATGATATAAVAVSSSTKDSENSSNSEVIELESTTIEEDSTNSDSFCKDQKGQSHSFTSDPSSNAQVASHQSSLSL